MTDQERRVRKGILARLIVATQARVEPETVTVYLDMTAGWSPEVLAQACERLGRTSQWFPKVGEITAECELVYKRAKERREEAQRLNEAPGVSEERRQELFRGLADLVKAKRWPA